MQDQPDQRGAGDHGERHPENDADAARPGCPRRAASALPLPLRARELPLALPAPDHRYLRGAPRPGAGPVAQSRSNASAIDACMHIEALPCLASPALGRLHVDNRRERTPVLIAAFPAGPWGTNCYVVAPAPGEECVVIDPGQGATPGVADVVREHRLRPAAVLLTHGHIDHMWSVAPVAGAYEAVAYIHPADRALLTDPLAGMSPETGRMLLGHDLHFAEPDDVRELSDGSALELAGLSFAVDHTLATHRAR